jgi:hypothetical protein
MPQCLCIPYSRFLKILSTGGKKSVLFLAAGRLGTLILAPKALKSAAGSRWLE